MEKQRTNLKLIANLRLHFQFNQNIKTYRVINMQMNSERYKGIEFVRISSLETREKAIIRQTLGHEKIIKILRDNELLNDCIQYHDYLAWRNQNFEKTGGVSHLN